MTRAEMQQVPIINKASENKFEFVLVGGVAVVEYEKRGDKFILVHTEVPEALQGQGVASIMVTKVMDYLSSKGFKMKPFCSYITSFLKRHPEYAELSED